MCRERIIIEFDDWAQNCSIAEIAQVGEAIDAGDFEKLASILSIADADDIRIERSVERWEVVR